MSNLATITPAMLPPKHMSWNQVLSTMEEDDRNEIVASLTDREAIDASTDWFLQARREQMPPPWDWYIWMMLAGRGFGKNWAGSNWFIDRHATGDIKNSAVVAATASDLRRYCIEGPSGILALAPSWFYPDYQPSKSKLVWPNGGTTLLYTSEKPERLRGPNFELAWVDELASWKYVEETWSMLQLCLRIGSPQVLITTTPKPKKLLRDLIKRLGVDVAVTRGSTYDNKLNLSKKFLEEINTQYKGTRLERQEIFGEILDEFEGALWNYKLLDECRVTEHPIFNRCGVGVDPAITAHEDSDKTGIVSGGIANGQGYITGEYSLRGSPEAWARKVIAVYKETGADFIVAEKNQGGDMVEATIKAVDPNANVRLVHASRGKITRAEPIAAMYEQHRIHHVGTFADLEDEMCLFLPGEPKVSPDSTDALVWLMSELMGGPNIVSPRIRRL